MPSLLSVTVSPVLLETLVTVSSSVPLNVIVEGAVSVPVTSELSLLSTVLSRVIRIRGPSFPVSPSPPPVSPPPVSPDSEPPVSPPEPASAPSSSSIASSP